jgi:hypothetical protein
LRSSAHWPCLLPAARVGAQSPDRFNEDLAKAITFRDVGPFRMGARIADIAVPASPTKAHLNTICVAPWTGGLFKTTNNGTTWTPIFDNVSTRLTVGAVSLAPSNPDIVWVGTGDAFTSRFSYAGDGVYKSTDAGKTWTHMGLDDTQHIARILIDPKNPDIVYALIENANPRSPTQQEIEQAQSFGRELRQQEVGG